jgi:hypothetical protein
MDYFFEDFTESEYEKLLKLAKKRWGFIKYSEYRSGKPVILWRHDLDFSVHRALRLAQIEARLGVWSTFFLSPHSTFYNLFEPEIKDIVLQIKELGHNFGLHFDGTFYSGMTNGLKDVDDILRFENSILEKMLLIEVDAFSLHNPDVATLPELDQDEIGGMVNASGAFLKENYSYISDSNGYWRFRRLKSVLEVGEDERLHVLTHPGWWVPNIMSPRLRVSRCIDGRARYQHARYDRILARLGRMNVGKRIPN